MMHTTKGSQETDRSGKSISAELGQTRMKVSVPHAKDDTIAITTRENPCNGNEENVFSLQNVSSESKLLCYKFIVNVFIIIQIIYFSLKM
jgi:hypothetical protein